MNKEIEKKIKGNGELSSLWNQIVIKALQLCMAEDENYISKLNGGKAKIDIDKLKDKSMILVNKFNRICERENVDIRIRLDQLLQIAMEEKIGKIS